MFRKEAWTGYGIQANSAAHPSHIVYFDIPGCEQVSFHFGPANPKRYPRYQGEWDGKEFSTLDKLEEAAVALFEKHEKGGAGEVGDEGVAA